MQHDAMTNLISMGDNMFEIEAAHILGAKFPNSFIKTVKFRASPAPNELVKQLGLVLQQFDFILNTPKNLSVRLLKPREAGAKGTPALEMEDLVAEEHGGSTEAPVQQKLDDASVASGNIMQEINNRKQ